MNFEIIDNAYQVTVLFICMLLSAWLGIRKRNRGFIMLSFGYGCFMMGTLFFVLHLAILGRVPQIFYTCEISWLAAYLFFLSLEILYWEKLHPAFSPLALVLGLAAMALIMKFEIFGPSPLMSGALAIAAGGLVYHCVSDLQREETPRLFELSLLLLVALQIILYIVSIFIKDYTRFNLYYVVDIALTLTMVSLLPHVLHEEDP